MSGLVRVFLGLVGAILLLPGLCSAGFMVFILPGLATGRNTGDAAMLITVWAFGFAIAWGGFVLLRKARRGGST